MEIMAQRYNDQAFTHQDLYYAKLNNDISLVNYLRQLHQNKIAMHVKAYENNANLYPLLWQKVSNESADLSVAMAINILDSYRTSIKNNPYEDPSFLAWQRKNRRPSTTGLAQCAIHTTQKYASTLDK